MRETKLFLAGAWENGDDTAVVRSPWDAVPVSRVARAGPPTLDRAAEAAAKAAAADGTASGSGPAAE